MSTRVGDEHKDFDAVMQALSRAHNTAPELPVAELLFEAVGADRWLKGLTDFSLTAALEGWTKERRLRRWSARRRTA